MPLTKRKNMNPNQNAAASPFLSNHDRCFYSHRRPLLLLSSATAASPFLSNHDRCFYSHRRPAALHRTEGQWIESTNQGTNLGDDVFSSRPYSGGTEKSFENSLADWNSKDPSRLLSLIIELRNAYVAYQRKQIGEVDDERLKFKISTMLPREGIEMYLSSSTEKLIVDDEHV